MQARGGRAAFGGRRLAFRIGINSGPVVAGVIGRKKFIYDLWGEAVNLASRMELHGQSGAIQITERTWRLVKDDFACEERGIIDSRRRPDPCLACLCWERATPWRIFIANEHSPRAIDALPRPNRP